MSNEKSYRPAVVPSQRPGKEGGARARNRRERTATLCEAALGLFLTKGVAPTTVDDITAAAVVAKGSFYRYFNDKVALIDALLAPLEAELFVSMDRCEARLGVAESASALTDAYGALAAELGALLFASPDVVRLYLMESRGPRSDARAPFRRVRDRVLDSALSLTRTAHRRGLIEDLPPPVTAVAVVGAVEGMIEAFFDGRDLGDPGEATHALIRMVLDGIRRVQ